jgi:nitrogen regulatory protein PII 1
MLMIRAIVRPNKSADVMAALMAAGFPAVTKLDVVGRGKQRGMKVGEVTYDEIPKELLFTVVEAKDKQFVVDTILKAARTGEKGSFGDGKIFISPVLEVYTVSSGIKEEDDISIEAEATPSETPTAAPAPSEAAT